MKISSIGAVQVMPNINLRSPVFLLFLSTVAVATEQEWIQVSKDGHSFVSESGKTFIPWGFNYDHDASGRLIEDWGKTPDEYRPVRSIREAIMLNWLELFREKHNTIKR